jgi:CheY-like chemotaxis protein
MSSDTFSPTSTVPTSTEGTPVPSTPQVHVRRVLIIESDVAVADELAQLMDELGHKTELASDAKTALLHLRDFKPHLVLLGTYLADMPGYELTAILRGAPQYAGLLHAVGLLFIADRSKLLSTASLAPPIFPHPITFLNLSTKTRCATKPNGRSRASWPFATRQAHKFALSCEQYAFVGTWAAVSFTSIAQEPFMRDANQGHGVPCP